MNHYKKASIALIVIGTVNVCLASQKESPRILKAPSNKLLAAMNEKAFKEKLASINSNYEADILLTPEEIAQLTDKKIAPKQSHSQRLQATKTKKKPSKPKTPREITDEEFDRILHEHSALMPKTSPSSAPKRPLPPLPNKKLTQPFAFGAQIITTEPEEDLPKSFYLTVDDEIVINVNGQPMHALAVFVNTYDQGSWSTTECVEDALQATPLSWLRIPVKGTTQTIHLNIKRYTEPDSYSLFEKDSKLYLGKTEFKEVFEVDFDGSLVYCE